MLATEVDIEYFREQKNEAKTKFKRALEALEEAERDLDLFHEDVNSWTLVKEEYALGVAQVEAAGRFGEVVMFPKLDKGGQIESAVVGRFQAKQQPIKAIEESRDLVRVMEPVGVCRVNGLESLPHT